MTVIESKLLTEPGTSSTPQRKVRQCAVVPSGRLVPLSELSRRPLAVQEQATERVIPAGLGAKLEGFTSSI